MEVFELYWFELTLSFSPQQVKYKNVTGTNTMIVWICGPSGAGKTTIGQALFNTLKKDYPNLFILDGDQFRWAMSNDLGYSAEDRRQNSHRIARMCKLLESQGIHVICCGVTIHPEVQKFNRESYQEYFEVLIETSFETLLQRDSKNIYGRALMGEIKEVAGVDIGFVAPSNPHLVINNDKDLSCFDGIVGQITSHLTLTTSIS